MKARAKEGKRSGSFAGKIEMTGETGGIFDEENSWPFPIIEWEELGVIGGMACSQDLGMIATLIIKHVQAT